MANKIIKFDTFMLSTDKHRVFKRETVYTNDKNSAELNFNVKDIEDLAPYTPNILLYMRDGSFYQISEGITKDGATVKYTLKDNEGKHGGLARTQLVLIDGESELASAKFEFNIESGLGGVASEVMIQDWSTLLKEARDYIDLFVDDEAQRQSTFESNEAARQSLYDDLVETGVLQSNINTKLAELEEEYAPQFADVTAQLAQTIKPEYRIDVTAPPKETGLAPLTMTDPVEDQQRLQSIFEYIKTNELFYAPGNQQSTGYTYTVYFPAGEYVLSDTVNVKGSFIRLIGERAQISTVTGSYVFETTGSSGWKLEMSGFSFINSNALKIVNNNLEAGKTDIYNNWFYYSPNEALWIDKQSSMTFIEKNHFYKCAKILYIIRTDSGYFEKNWINSTYRTSEYPEDMEIHNRFYIKDTYFIPTGYSETYTTDIAWIKSTSYVKIENSRFSSEAGSKVLVNSHAKFASASMQCGVEIVNNDYLAAQHGSAYVRLYDMPNIIKITDNLCTRVPDQLIRLSESFDTVSLPDYDSPNVIIDVSGNVGRTNNVWTIPDVLKPYIRNIDLMNNGRWGINEKKPQADIHISQPIAPKVIFESKNNTITTGDEIGSFDFIGNDASHQSSGVRARIVAETMDNTGKTDVVIYATGTANDTLIEVARFSTT